MNIQTIKSMITSKVGRQLLVTQKHSPKILFVAGTAGVIATVVLAARATLKLEEVLDEHSKDVVTAEDVSAKHAESYTDTDYRRDLAVIYTRTALKIAKLYAPAVTIGVASIGALTGSHIILNRRNVSLTAAYAALDRGFRQYRERVIGELGPEKEREFRYDLEKCEIVEETEEGPVTRGVNKILASRSPYARIFDELGSTSWSPEPSYNQLFLQCQQNYANDLLKSRGHVFLNEIYDMLGMQRSKEGAVVGWVLDGGTSDNFVDFGIFHGNMHEAFMFVKGEEHSIWLDFNVDGVIYDLI